MPVKPPIITFLSAVFLLSPLVMVVQTAILVNLPLWGSVTIWQKLSWYDLLILASYPVASMCIWSVRKPGWYGFLAVSLFLMVSNVVVLFMRPSYSALVVLLYNGLLIAVTAVFFRRNIMTPYFEPRVRWWENLPRFHALVSLRLLGADSKVDLILRDISETGCFASSPVDSGMAGHLSLELQCFGHCLLLEAEVVRVVETDSGPGLGLRFIEPEHNAKVLIRSMVAKLSREIDTASRVPGQRGRAARVILRDQALVHNALVSGPARLVDISRGGASLETATPLEPMDDVRLVWEGFGLRIDTAGIVVWTREGAGCRTVGISFRKLMPGDRVSLTRLIRRLDTLGARQRRMETISSESLEAFALKTPYRYVRALSRSVLGLVPRQTRP